VRPLEGILVVGIEQAVAAPFATRQLADLGARVVKIERPGSGDFARSYDARARGLSSHFVWTNRGKESLTLDLKHPAARDVLDRLLDRADVLVQNLAPGATARLGLSEEALRPRWPRLVLCDISGYGDAGPYRDRKAYDLLVQAEAAVLSITGTPEQRAKTGLSVADIAAGMYAFSGVLAALYERERTGRGRRVEVTMLESLAEWMGYPLHYTTDGAPPPPRTGARHATIVPYGPVRTTDGEILVAVQNEREWARFCADVLGDASLASDPRFATLQDRSAHGEALAGLVQRRFSGWTTAEASERLDAAKIAWSVVRDLDGLWDHPQLRARQRWTTAGSEVGPLPALLPPFASPGDAAGDVPAVGQHTDAILGSLGFSPAEIGGFRERGVV
jgi:itaconate CoA-transferase